MNLKDLCTLGILPQVLEAGVYSLKIEGRMKSPQYTAGVVSVYRKYVDRYLAEGGADWQVDPEDIRLLLELFDRGGFTDGYYTRHNSASMVFTGKKPERRIADEELRRQLEEKYIQSELQEKIKGKVRIQEGMPVTITVSAGACSVSLQGEEAGEAKSRPLTEADVRKQFSKTGGSGYQWEELVIELGDNAFVPVGVMNRLRREALEKLTRRRLYEYQRID